MIFSPQSTMRNGYEFSSKRSIGHGDAGWGVAQKEPKLDRYEWVWVTAAPGVRVRHLVVQVNPEYHARRPKVEAYRLLMEAELWPRGAIAVFRKISEEP